MRGSPQEISIAALGQKRPGGPTKGPYSKFPDPANHPDGLGDTDDPEVFVRRILECTGSAAKFNGVLARVDF